MKRLLIASLVCLTTALFADTWTDPETGITWTYTVTNGVATIYNNGTAAIATSTRGQVRIPSVLDGYPVTSIGEHAFDECLSVTSFQIPEGLNSIGSYAFRKCTSLVEASIPEGVEGIGKCTFYACSNLEKITLPSTLHTIEGANFSLCVKLKEIKVPEGVTSLGHENFCHGCVALTKVELPSTLKTIGKQSFYNCSSLVEVNIPESVTLIGEDAFSGCSKLEIVRIDEVKAWCTVLFESAASNPLMYTQKSILYTEGDVTTTVKIPDGIVALTTNAFKNCKDLVSVEFPSTLTSIGGAAFSGCSSLTSVVIPNRVTSINGYTFSNCSALESVTIPSSVTTIESTAFNNVAPTNLTATWIPTGMLKEKLVKVVIPKGTTTIRSQAFSGCTGLTSITIPEGVTSSEGSAFYNCSKLSSVTIPSSVATIESTAFNNVAPKNLTAAWVPTGMLKEKLVKVVIPEGTTTIRSQAFYSCTGLTSITIPEGVTSIEDSAFYNCSKLSSVTIPESVISIGRYAFTHQSDQCNLKKAIFLGAPPSTGAFAGFLSATIYYRKKYAQSWMNLRATQPEEVSTASFSSQTSWICFDDVSIISMFNGGTVEVTQGNYLPGTFTSLTAIPSDGYMFLGWSSNVEGISSVEPTITVKLQDGERLILVANFFPKALLTTLVNETLNATLDAKVDARIEAKIDGKKLLTAEQSAAKTATTIKTKVAAGELITSDQLQEMALSEPVIEVKEGAATVGISVMKASSVDGEWEVIELDSNTTAVESDKIQVTVPADEKAAFYKFVVPENQ